MSVLRRAPTARRALADAARLAVAGAQVAATPALVATGLVAGSSRAAVRAAAGLTSRVVGRPVDLARAAVSGVRAVGTLVTGADPVPTGRIRELADVASGMFEPAGDRHTPRVWADRGLVQVEVPAPSPDAPPETRRALRRQLEPADSSSALQMETQS